VCRAFQCDYAKWSVLRPNLRRKVKRSALVECGVGEREGKGRHEGEPGACHSSFSLSRTGNKE
jgi:hypothetical protein